jgi:hypothetical protein
MIGSGCTPYQIYIAGDKYYNAGGAMVVLGVKVACPSILLL